MSEYITIWWISLIYFVMSILIALFLQFQVHPAIKNVIFMGMIHPPLILPISLQIASGILLLGGLSAIVSFCSLQRAPLRLFLGCIPLLLVSIFYEFPQMMFDVHWYTWRYVDSLYLLSITPVLFLVTSCFFLVLGIIVFLRKRSNLRASRQN